MEENYEVKERKIMGWFNNKKELDSKAMHISVMYLDKAKFELEKRLYRIKQSNGDTFTTEHDIKCIERAIEYLKTN